MDGTPSNQRRSRHTQVCRNPFSMSSSSVGHYTGGMCRRDTVNAVAAARIGIFPLDCLSCSMMRPTLDSKPNGYLLG